MTFKISGFTLVCAGVIAAQAALAAYVAAFGPTHPIPMHFNADGVADRWGGRAEVGAVLAVMAGMSALLISVIGALSLRAGAGSAAGAKSFRAAQTIMLFTMAAISVFAAAQMLGAIGKLHPGGGLPATFICLLLAGVGAYLGKVGPNPLVGVRTPWTYSSRLAWDKSNRLAGRLLLWGGVAGAASAPFIPQPLGLRVTIFGVLAIAAVTVFESWRVWRTDPDRTSAM